MAAVSCSRIAISAADADASAARSSSDPFRVFSSPATIISSDVPTAEASADADPPPGVGSGALNAARISRTVLSASMNDASLFDHRPDCVGANTDQINRRTVDDHRVHLLAGFEASDDLVAVERVRRVDGRADQRFFEGEAH